MAYIYSELAAQVKQWAQQAVTNQWLDANEVAPLLETDSRSPQSLFGTDQTGFKKLSGFTRPLIVAFMGGTGVGKSSLLNRLAGQAIAKAGIERPTSREVTLYHH
jgi:putative ribosome biogenesis GTPase RsgA